MQKISESEFLEVKIGDRFEFNGYPMELIAVGNVLVADHQRVEIVTLQKLEDKTSRGQLADALKESGFTLALQKEIVATAIGREDFRTTAELTVEEATEALEAVWAAVADREQLEEQR
jgi:hypothetical protein